MPTEKESLGHVCIWKYDANNPSSTGSMLMIKQTELKWESVKNTHSRVLNVNITIQSISTITCKNQSNKY